MIVYNHFENDSRVLKEALTLSAANYDVHILAIWKAGLERRERIQEITVHRIDLIPLHKRIIGEKNYKKLKSLVYKQPSKPPSTGTGAIFKPYSKRRLSTVKFFFSGLNKLLSFIGFYRGAALYLKRIGLRADIYHAHDLNTLYLGNMMADKHQARLVYDSHELYVFRNRPYLPPPWFLRMEERFERRLIRRADAVITVSRSICDHLETRYEIAPPHLIMNAPGKKMSVEASGASLRASIGIPPDQKLLLYTGAISFSRGLDHIIRSLSQLPNCHFVMMGRGVAGFKAYLESVAQQMGVSDRVSFFGPVPSDQVTAYAASADAGVAPIENGCLSYYYCAPNKVFEYIQGGLPVAASNFPDLQEVVETNDIGCTFDPADPHSIARAVAEVLRSADRYRDNVRKITDKYCWENEEKKLLALYAEL